MQTDQNVGVVGDFGHSNVVDAVYNNTAIEDSNRQYEQYDPNDISINVIGGGGAK